MKTCNDGGYCQYKVYSGSLWGCGYEGYCDFQRPKDSRMQPLINYDLSASPCQKCTCGTSEKCPIHQPQG